MHRKAKAKIKRILRTYAYLEAASWNAISLAKRSKEGQFYNLMTAMLFSAFTLEAFLNHLGAKRISYWDVLQRKLGPEEKLQVLCKDIGYKPDRSRPPFQTFSIIFDFRNAIVHAKTEYPSYEGELILEEGQRPPKPLVGWEKQITLDTAQRFFDDTKAMLTELHYAAKLREPLFIPEEVFGETEWLPEVKA